MTLAAKTKLVNAESIKKILLEKKWYNKDFFSKKDKKFIYFPLNKKVKIPKSDIVQKRFLKKSNKKSLKSLLKYKLSEKELSKLVRSYEVLGSIAVMEIPNELNKKEKLIAQTVLKLNKNIKTVLKKSGIHIGEFRTQKLKWLAGKKTKETLYKENNVLIKFDVEKVYFSMRLSSERKRVFKQIKTGETILVMFSGCGPYVLTIAKNSKAKQVFGIEKNRMGHKYGLENLKLNNLNNIFLLLGDVKKLTPKLNKKFDRIIMPLPKSAEEFLYLIPKVSKKGTIIHFYAFGTDEQIKKVKSLIKRKLPNTRMLRTVRCGSYSPGVFRNCIDFKITSLK